MAVDRSSSAPGRPGLTPRGAGKRGRILDAAAAVLARSGYAGTTLAEIASLAGTQAGSLYYYFDSREELVQAVLVQGVVDAHAYTAGAVDALPDGSSSKDRLVAAVTAHIEYMLGGSDYAMAGVRAIGQLPEPIDAVVVEHQRAYGQFFAGLFEAAAADGHLDDQVDLSAARMLVVGAANWTPEWFDPSGTSSAPELAALLARLLFDGLAPGRGGAQPGAGERRSRASARANNP